MAPPQVWIDVDVVDGGGHPPSQGFAYMYPSVSVSDPADGLDITTSAAGYPLTGSLVSIQVYATDNPNMSPANFTWFLDFSKNPFVPGGPAPILFTAPAGPCSFTATNASPCVFTWTPTSAFSSAFPAGLPLGTAVTLAGGSLPAGFTAGPTYYVVSAPTATTFTLSATRGGTAVNSSGTGSGTFTVTRYTYSGLAPGVPSPGVVSPSLQSVRNLSDVANTATAAMNIGLGAVFALDNYAGTDDAKMASALAAAVAAGGGTILLGARVHNFANQWSTAYVSQTSLTNILIKGAGAGAPGGLSNNTTSSPTKCVFSYNGAGAGQMDFQHAGDIEITGIWFYDTTTTVPFYFSTYSNPQIHDCVFTGAGSGTSCAKDAIVLGGSGAGSGDTAKFSGYGGAYVSRCYFDSIRRAVTFGGGCNAVKVHDNVISAICGSSDPFGAPFYFNGNVSHGNSGNLLTGNLVEQTFYHYVTATNGSANANYNVIGPNDTWDASNVIISYWDSSCSGNVVIDTDARAAPGSPAQMDLNGTNTVLSTTRPSKFTNVSGGTACDSLVVDGANLVVRNLGYVPPWAEGYLGGRAGMGIFNAFPTPFAQVVVLPGDSVTDGACYTGSRYITSATAAWNSNHVGSFIASSPSNAGVPSNSRILQVLTPATAAGYGFGWLASTAYNLGDVISPATPNSHLYRCTTAGTTASSAPVFPTGGGTVTDGTVVWTDLGTAATACYSSINATQTATGLSIGYHTLTSANALQMTKFANHHIVGSGAAPTYAVNTAAGTGATVTVNGGLDLGHRVTLTTGSGPTTGLLCTGTPGQSFTGSGFASACSVTPTNAAAAGLGLYVVLTSGVWQISAANAPAPSTAYTFNVLTLG